MSARGKFITVEGGEGCGKSTQARLLFEALNAADIPTILTREPGGTDGAEEIRALLVRGETGRWDKITETLLLMSARRDHVVKLIHPALERGEWVISDRFMDSTIAYQGYGHGVKLELIQALHTLVLGEFHPDLTLLFDIDVEKGIERAQAREAARAKKENRYERMGTVFHKNVRRGFLEAAKLHPERCAVIESDSSIYDIHLAAVSRVQFHLQKTVKPLSRAQVEKAVS